jgi:molybdenum cofactor cytidylyltransferase
VACSRVEGDFILAQSFVSGVILAAGTSSRLGQPKQLLDLHGEPLLRWTVRNAIASGLDEVVLVLGARAEEIGTAVGELGQRTVINPDFAKGQGTSLVAGLKAIDARVEGILFMLGDQPQVGPEIIDLLIERFRDAGAPIVQPVYGGIPANPVLFSLTLKDELLAITGDEGARSIVRAHKKDIVFVSVSDGPPPRDVDTIEDYQALITEMTSQPNLS